MSFWRPWENPATTKWQIGLYSHWKTKDLRNDLPLSPAEILKKKAFLKKYAPSSYFQIFPEERGAVHGLEPK